MRESWRTRKKFSGPVPPANQQHGGPPAANEHAGEQAQAHDGKQGDQEQDPKRRLGDYTGKGEHSYQQPGGLHDADH